MGVPQDVQNVRTTKARRLHPFRRIARLILISRRVPQLPEHPSQQACRGPSILHNLLPILEPLFAIDPKLLFIEDRIIGRERPTYPASDTRLPSNLQELNVQVQSASAPCNCDECEPKLYQLSDGSSHGNIQILTGIKRPRKSRFTRAPRLAQVPRPKLSLRLYGDYEAMRLVRHHIAWLDQTYLQESRAILQMKSLVETWKPNLSCTNMRQSISRTQLQQLFAQLNKVFFFDSVPAHQEALTTGFSWLPESKKDCFGISYFNPIIGTQLLLHPVLYRHSSNVQSPDDIWRNRLGTILHEMCHAYLKAYTCRSCPMHDHCVGARGHGRAWQLLAAKIEEVASRLMGGLVDMGRFPALLHDMEGHGKLPSSHDLETWELRVATNSFSSQESEKLEIVLTDNVPNV